MSRPAVYIHLPMPFLLGIEKIPPYFHKLRDGLDARGIGVEIEALERDTLLARVEADANFHIVNHGDLVHPRILNTALAYIPPFWYLDAAGVRRAAAIGARTFDPGTVDTQAARRFFQALRQRVVGGRISRYAQPQGRAEFAPGRIAVFLQNETADADAFVPRAAMIAALLDRHDPAQIVLKPHPRDRGAATRDLLAQSAARDPRVKVSEANLHDILSGASVTVTINSGVGLESHLHRVPVVLCGPADFHHGCVTARDAFGLDAAIARARNTPWPHEAFLYWFLKLNCVNAGAPDMIDDVLARIAATGYEVGRLLPGGVRA